MSLSTLDRRQRNAARFALYASLGAVGVLLVLGLLYLRTLAPQGLDTSYRNVDWAAIPAVHLLQGYLQIDTAQPHAREEAGARFLADVLNRAGIPATVELLDQGHANVFAVLEGEDRAALVLHNHIDTDPVRNPEEWTHPPFSGAIDPPFIYGRGAYDMKSIAIAQLQAMLDLKASGQKLKRSVIFLGTGTEEVGSAQGTKWILAHHPELAERFWAFLSEGGVVEARSIDEPQYWGIEFAQKRYVDVVFCSQSRERLEALREDLLAERKDGNFEVTSTPEVRAFLETYAPSRQKPFFRKVLEHPDGLKLDGAAWSELPIYLKAMFRSEALPLLVEEVDGGGYRLVVKLHLLPGADAEAVRQRLLPDWMVGDLPFYIYDEHGGAHGSSLANPVFEVLSDELKHEWPEAVVGPHFLPWTATDSRFARAQGIPAYGFSPFLLFISESSRIGDVDERMSLPAFVRGVEVYHRAVFRLVT